jgi:NAD(P)-dependent dehydrogenase (short-subunit alcohol dehydrogenase family)
MKITTIGKDTMRPNGDIPTAQPENAGHPVHIAASITAETAELKGKRALITGGTSGIGSATARSMAASGAEVILTGRDQALGEQVVAEIQQADGGARFLAAELTEIDEVGRVVDEAGAVDVLVNCAGFYTVAATSDVDPATFDRHFAVNVKAPFFLVGALAPGMASRGGGVIINVSTMVASFGQPGMSAYGASRAAVELLTKAWAAEYGPQGSASMPSRPVRPGRRRWNR